MNEQLLGMLGLLGIGAGGAAATSSAYDRLKEIGNQAVLGANVTDPVTGETLQIPGAAQIASESLGLSQFRPFTVTTATGGQFGVTPQVDPKTGVVTGLGTTMGLSPAEQQLQQTLMGQAQQGLGATPFGQQMGQQAATSAFGLGSQFMGAAAQQPSDLNLLRGMFTQQAAGGLGGGQPQMGQFSPEAAALRAQRDAAMSPEERAGIQAMRERDAARQRAMAEAAGITSGLDGLISKGMSPDMLMVTSPTGQQMPVSRQDPRLQGLSDDQIRAKLADPSAYQQAPTIGEFGQRALGLGMAGLDAQAPSDVEALRRQYTQLASQTAGRALQDTAGREADVYERIRATQRPEEERQRLALEERMAQQGRLGVRTAMYGGTPEQAALAMQQEEAQNRASLAAIQQAQAERQQAVGEAQTFGGLFGQQAGLSSQLQSAAQARAAQLSQLGLSSQQIESQLQSEGLGRSVTSASQAAQLAQVAGGLQAQQAGLGAQYAGLGSQLAMQNLAAQQAQQQLGLGALTGAYMPQAQLLNAMQAQQMYPQLQQQAQLFGTGQYGETMMSGLEARLIAEQARANLIGGIGSGLLGGLFSPIATQGGGVGSLFTGILDMLGGGDEDNSGGSGGGSVPPAT
jgi:hypothetical protein